MELHLTPDTEAKLNELVQRTQRGTDELLEEAVMQLVSYNEWFERKVRDSQSEVDSGKTVSNEQVFAWLKDREQRQA